MDHKRDLKVSSVVLLALAVLFALLGVSEVKVCMFFVFSFVNATAVQIIESIEARIGEGEE